MKHSFFSTFLSAAVLMGCSHVQYTKRIPASGKDVGVIAKACDPNTILGMTPAQARSNCQGKSNKVPVEYFKQSIRNLVSLIG